MATITVGITSALNTDALQLTNLFQGSVLTASSSTYVVGYRDGSQDQFYGSGFTYDAQVVPNGGAIAEYRGLYPNGALGVDITGISLSVPTFLNFVRNNDNQGLLSFLFSGDDTFVGSAQGDLIRGFGGNDTLRGAGGNDFLDGGAGVDTVVFSGSLADYSIVHQANGSYTVTDARQGSPDGTDTVINVELAQYSDGLYPFLSTVAQVVRFDHILVLRTDPYFGANAAAFSTQANSAESGSLTLQQIASQVAIMADTTTSVATMAYQFFTGKTPTPAGLDYLVSPTGPNQNNLNSPYYAQFNAENRYINFAVALGKVGEGAAQFNASYGSLSLFDATRQAYSSVFGSTPTDAKIHSLIDTRVDYFAYYGGDGANGQGTKAAMIGWLIAEADKAHIGTLETANFSYLLDLAAGKISDRVDLIGVYHGTPYTGG